mgnify:CR=1 FL=1
MLWFQSIGRVLVPDPMGEDIFSWISVNVTYGTEMPSQYRDESGELPLIALKKISLTDGEIDIMTTRLPFTDCMAVPRTCASL